MGLTNIPRTPTARTAAAIAAAITILWNAAAIARIFELAFALQLDELIRAMLEAYEKFMSAVFRYIDPLVKSALAWAGFEVNLWPHWKHVFALMMLYFVMHSRSAWLEGNIGAARFVAVWGFIVAFASSVAAGLVHSDVGLTAVLFAVPPVVGLVVYGAGTSARAATWFRGSDEMWAKAFAEFFRHSRRFAIAGLLAIVVATVLVSAKLTPDWLTNPGIALL